MARNFVQKDADLGYKAQMYVIDALPSHNHIEYEHGSDDDDWRARNGWHVDAILEDVRLDFKVTKQDGEFFLSKSLIEAKKSAPDFLVVVNFKFITSRNFNPALVHFLKFDSARNYALQICASHGWYEKKRKKPDGTEAVTQGIYMPNIYKAFRQVYSYKDEGLVMAIPYNEFIKRLNA